VQFNSGRSRLPLRRFIVADRSMEPGLVEGQGLLATPYGQARTGQVRCFEHPDRPGFWLVKRVDEVAGSTMSVRSDNPAGVDSRTLGRVPVAGSYRVLLDRNPVGVPAGHDDRVRNVLDGTVFDPEFVHPPHPAVHGIGAFHSETHVVETHPRRIEPIGVGVESGHADHESVRPQQPQPVPTRTLPVRDVRRAEEALIEVGAAPHVRDREGHMMHEWQVHAPTVRCRGEH
jgi:hypothetical protein